MILTMMKPDLTRSDRRSISRHNKMNDGAKEADFLGQEKLILGHNVKNYGTNRVTFWDRRS